jgi:2-polyprenyl-3-methyl-5-hydroxy-6-metoxy-1,4-benzoquinol methylase
MAFQTEIIDHCPNCQSDKLSIWSRGTDILHRITSQEFVYSECSACHLVFQSTRPQEKEIAGFYPTDYDPYTGEISNTETANTILKVGYRKVQFFRKLNQYLDKFFKNSCYQKIDEYYTPKNSGMTLLDFGCGSDSFLNKAKAKNWNTIGMDFIEQPLLSVKGSGHRAVLYSSENAWNEIEDGSIDMIRVNHVLEHLYHPQEVLKNLFKKLKKGGILHIAIPNPSGIAASKYKNNWRGLDCPRHIMLYPPELLKDILATKVGFSFVDILFEEITKDYARSMGYKLLEQKKIQYEHVEKLMNHAELAAVLHWRAKLASLMKKSDRFHVFATK